MWMCVLCLLLVNESLTHTWKTVYTIKGREEGDECRRKNDAVWRCKRGSECEELGDILEANGVIETCSFKGQTPILCCREKSEPVRVQLSKSEEKCAEYTKLLCNEQRPYVWPPHIKPTFQQPTPAVLQRERRQDPSTIRPDQPYSQPSSQSGQHTSTQQPVSMAGGRETRATEDPSNIPGIFRRVGVDSAVNLIGGRFTRAAEVPSMQVNTARQFASVPFVTGGIKAKPKDNRHMALIGYGDAGSISWQCGGLLISNNFVLSAAHCVNTPYGLARWVRLGDLDLKSDKDDARPQQLEIVERVVHPGYHSPAYYNDVALFRLERAVVFDHYVKPACLHTDTRDLTGVGTAAGWGKNETSGPKSSALMQVGISFVPSQECKRLVGVVDKYLPNGLDTETMVCAGELGKDTCQGDSGGPLILPPPDWSNSECLAKLVGVTSFGPKNCGMTSVPGAYVRVAHFVPWIESIVWP